MDYCCLRVMIYHQVFTANLMACQIPFVLYVIKFKLAFFATVSPFRCCKDLFRVRCNYI